MQILESTANDLTNNIHLDLYNEKDNIFIGTKYLKFLLDKYDGNIYLAICAYNAGMGNVDNWLNLHIISKNNLQINCIPFNETKKYLINILYYYNNYVKLYK